jgi:Uma2 family endonuclease
MSAVMPCVDQAVYRIRPITVTEFHSIGQAGMFAADERVELIEGELITLSPIGSPHAACVKKLSNFLAHELFGRAIVSTQDPVVLRELSEPQPDVTVLKFRDDYYESAHPEPQDVLLLIEVADSSIRYDHEIKVSLYARYVIPEFWLFDLTEGRLEVYREPIDGEYRHRDYHRHGNVTPGLLPGVLVSLDGIFA